MIYKENLKNPLSITQELELLTKYSETKDINMRNKIVEHNLKLVIYVINKYFSSYYNELDDLFIIGSIGLINAIENYNISLNNKFSSYAVKSILNSIYEYYRKKNYNLSLNSKCYLDDNTEYIDLLEGNDIIASSFNKLLIEELISDLTREEKDILLSFYGALGYTKRTQKELAIKYNISRQYVQVIINKSINKINKKYNDKYKLSIYNIFNTYKKEEINEALKLLSKEELNRLRNTKIRELNENGKEKELYLRIKSLVK